MPDRQSLRACGEATYALHQVLADAFVDEGTACVFCLMGDGNKRWLVDMAARRVRLVHARHEGAALAMADGYARARGDVGVCAVTYGPGVAQLSTSLLVAVKHGTPIVVFAADVGATWRDSGGHLDVDARAMLQATGARVRRVRLAEQAGDDVHAAFAEARQEQCPVALLVAADIQHLEASRTPASPAPRRTVRLARSVADPASLDRAVAVLKRSRRVALLAGHGAVVSNARAEIDRLAGQLGAVVATTFGAKGWCDDHPRFVGLAGGFALDATKSVFRRADCVVAVGASLNANTTDQGRLFPAASVIRIDARPGAARGSGSPPDVTLCGDAAVTVGALADRCHTARLPPAGWTADHLVPVLSADPRSAQMELRPAKVEHNKIDPRRLMLELDRTLPADAVVVIGGGHFMAFAALYLQNRGGGRTFHLVFDAMTTGQAVPAAIGAAVGSSNRPVVAIEGDASFLMHVQELETAARSGIGVLVIVVNDGALGAEYHKLAAEGCDPSIALAPTPDLAGVARALGGRGQRVETIEAVANLATWFDQTNGPHVADCQVTRSVVGPL